jgi:hypothetical protein
MMDNEKLTLVRRLGSLDRVQPNGQFFWFTANA